MVAPSMGLTSMVTVRPASMTTGGVGDGAAGVPASSARATPLAIARAA